MAAAQKETDGQIVVEHLTVVAASDSDNAHAFSHGALSFPFPHLHPSFNPSHF